MKQVTVYKILHMHVTTEAMTTAHLAIQVSIPIPLLFLNFFYDKVAICHCFL